MDSGFFVVVFYVFNYQIDFDNRINHLSPNGSFTMNEIIQFFKKLVLDSAWDPNFNILKDFTRVDQIDLSYDEINEIVDKQNFFGKDLFASKIAIVAPTDST